MHSYKQPPYKQHAYKHGGDTYALPRLRLDFSVNLNPLGMPQEVKEVLQQQLEQFSCYPDPYCRQLRLALAQQEGLSPQQILCGNGATDLIFRLCACRKPQQALVLAPTFSEYARCVRLFGGQVREYQLRAEQGFMLNEDFLQQLGAELDMVFLCQPNNPSGTLIPAQLLQKIAERCEENNIILLVDECFLAFSSGSSLLPLLPQYPHLLILRAFTKLYALAGLRLGYLAGDSSLLQEISRFGAEWSVSVPAQLAGAAALMAEPQWSSKTRQLVAEERAFLSPQLSRLGLTVFPAAANFLLLYSPLPLAEPLLEQGLLVRDCSNFSGLDRHYIRIGLKKRAENMQLLAALREICHG